MKFCSIPQKVHFVGIGGIGISSLAQHLHANGYVVTGSDRSKNDVTLKLQNIGVKVYFGHSAQTVGDAQLVVRTSAVPLDNAEVAFALKNGIPVILREQLLGAVFDQFPTRVAVCGTHGKTTVTAMISHVLAKAGIKHTAFMGGLVNGTNYVGGGKVVVAEACEYNRSFLHLHPTHTLCLNADFDHPDCYADLKDVHDAFGRFFDNTVTDGVVILPKNLQKLAKTNKICLWDNCLAQNYCIKNGVAHCLVTIDGATYNLQLKTLGLHNVYNAIASLQTAKLLGVPIADGAQYLADFDGVDRRFSQQNGKYFAVCDYAHHPTEIVAAIQTAKQLRNGKCVCVFQPHTYSRTQALWYQFATCFTLADSVIYLPIYYAREQPLPGITGQKLCAYARSVGINAFFADSFLSCANIVKSMATNADTVLILGAGDVNALAKYLQ